MAAPGRWAAAGHLDVPRSRGCAGSGVRAQPCFVPHTRSPSILAAIRAPAPRRTHPATTPQPGTGSCGDRGRGRTAPLPRCNRDKALPRRGPGAPGPADKAPRPEPLHRRAGSRPPAMRPPRPEPRRVRRCRSRCGAVRCRVLPGDQARGAARPPGPQHAAARGCGPAGAAGGAAAAGPPHRVKAVAAPARPGSATKGPARHGFPRSARPIKMGLGSHPPAGTASPNRSPRRCSAPQ